jgi:glycosyltransferase involved in cell wall biosynthesis
MLEYLARRYRVEAIFFRQPGAAEPQGAMPRQLVTDACTITLPYHGRGAVARVGRNLKRWARGIPPLVDRFRGFEEEVRRFTAGKRYELAVIEHSWCLPYVEVIAARRVVANLHNVESVWHRRMGALEWGWLHARFARGYERLEREWLPRFDLVLAPSAADVGYLPAGVKAAVYPNTIPATARGAAVRKAPRVIFSANLEYAPNQAAVAWFAREIWPVVAARRKELEWVVAGRNPEAVARWIRGLPRVRVTGRVPSLREEIAGAMVAVAPIRAGSGTRVKILEAWAAGTAVVSTRLGAEGLPTQAVALADTGEEFVAAIERLLDDSAARVAMEREAAAILEAEFTWEAGWNCLERLGI